jgi:hypothetical protein
MINTLIRHIIDRTFFMQFTEKGYPLEALITTQLHEKLPWHNRKENKLPKL